LHGKSPRDGTGGTVKWLVANSSLQATERNHILTPEVSKKILHENYIILHNIESNQATCSKTDRLQYAKTAPGTWSHHKFVPINT
jgi:hypothetical protein